MRSLRLGLVAAALLLPLVAAQAQAPPGVAALPRAHAHNDYLHPRPLLDALERGFGSVEADVWLVDGELLVAHDRDEVRAGRTLQRLYLDPLRQRVRDNGGRVHPDLPSLTLLIDLKSEAEPTYAALDSVLRGYADLLTLFTRDATRPGPVTAIISGNRPRDTMRAASIRFAAYDGRLPDLHPDSAAVPAAFLPLVSDHWSRVSAWKGEGRFPEADHARLTEVVREAHRQGRRVRFWAVPDRPDAWRVLLDAGVDLINTDDLDGLRDFLRAGR